MQMKRTVNAYSRMSIASTQNTFAGRHKWFTETQI